MSLPAIDAFTRANETPLAGNWTQCLGEPDALNLNTNHVVSIASDSGYYWNADIFPDAQYVQANITHDAVAAPDSGSGVIFRIMTNGAALRNYHRLTINGDGEWCLSVFLAGVATIQLQGVVAYSAGALLRAEANGQTILGFYNGALLFAGKYAKLACGQVGIGYSSSGNGTIDNFEGGALTPYRFNRTNNQPKQLLRRFY